MNCLDKKIQKLAQSIMSRGAKDAPVAICWNPKTCSLQSGGGALKRKLDILCSQGLLILVGVYGRPWPDGAAIGKTKMLTEWILADLAEIVKEEKSP